MHIMTDAGWKALQPPNAIPAADLDERYRGRLPSRQIVAYLQWLETETVKQRDARLQTHLQAAA